MPEQKKLIRKPKKFRSQILAKWIIENYRPCRVADIGGGKGLLSYLLNQNGFDSTVIDPEVQALPSKYTDLDKKKVKITTESQVKRISERFTKDMARNFDLLVGLHVHGSCIYIIESAAEYQKDFVLLPCCVIDEPITKLPDINWRDSLFGLAESKRLNPQLVKLNFMGKDIAIYTKNNVK